MEPLIVYIESLISLKSLSLVHGTINSLESLIRLASLPIVYGVIRAIK